MVNYPNRIAKINVFSKASCVILKNTKAKYNHTTKLNAHTEITA